MSRNPFYVLENAFRALLESIDGIDEEALQNTPRRAALFYQEFLTGYRENAELGVCFDVETLGDMVISRHIPFESLCQHHLLPFYGYASIGYITGRGKVVGVSKLARLVHKYSHRLQIQEAMTSQIADELWNNVKGTSNTGGVMVVVRAVHLCEKIRGVKSDGEMITSAVRGVFEVKPEARDEFLKLAT